VKGEVKGNLIGCSNLVERGRLREWANRENETVLGNTLLVLEKKTAYVEGLGIKRKGSVPKVRRRGKDKHTLYLNQYVKSGEKGSQEHRKRKF